MEGCPSGQRGRAVNPLTYVFIGSNPIFPTQRARVAQLVERQPSKLRVAGSNPVSRSNFASRCSSGVERFLGKEEVTGSIPVIGSIGIKISRFKNNSKLRIKTS